MNANGSGDDDRDEKDDDVQDGDDMAPSVLPGTHIRVSGKSDLMKRPCSFAN